MGICYKFNLLATEKLNATNKLYYGMNVILVENDAENFKIKTSSIVQKRTIILTKFHKVKKVI